MERLLRKLIRKKLTSLDKFPPTELAQKIESPPFLFPPLKFQKKFPPTNMSCLKLWSPPFTKEGGGGGGGGGNYVFGQNLSHCPPNFKFFLHFYNFKTFSQSVKKI